MLFLPRPAAFLRRLAPIAALVAACALGGCQTDGRRSMASVSTSGAPVSGTTLAFDSIDGPPQDVFDNLLRTLEAEAQTRNLAIVSRESPAAYRLRGYYSAQVKRGEVTIAWVWDIYDRDQERQLRLSGEAPAGRGSAQTAWKAANAQVLSTITKRGMDGIASLLADPAAAPPASPPGNGPLVAETPSTAGSGRALAFRAE